MESENQVAEHAPNVNYENLPPMVKRFQSLIIDQVFIITCMVIFSQILPDNNGDGTGALRGFLFLSLFFVYEPFCMAYGCTIGNKISGIRVRKFSNTEQRINLSNSYVRFIVKALLGIISFFSVTSDKWKRAIHDKAAGSIMIYAVQENSISRL